MTEGPSLLLIIKGKELNTDASKEA
ncbi:MAG: hypothetical protein US97_C0041G0001, partial [Microgenomates group bacterium GW2011_GWF1_38_5]